MLVAECVTEHPLPSDLLFSYQGSPDWDYLKDFLSDVYLSTNCKFQRVFGRHFFNFFYFSPSFHSFKLTISEGISLLELVSQRSPITPTGLSVTCNLMAIPVPHTLGYHQKQTYWFPCTWSQQDEFSSFVITDFCERFFLYPEPYSRKEKNMTRPKKDEQTVRSNSIHIRMNDTEYEL